MRRHIQPDQAFVLMNLIRLLLVIITLTEHVNYFSSMKISWLGQVLLLVKLWHFWAVGRPDARAMLVVGFYLVRLLAFTILISGMSFRMALDLGLHLDSQRLVELGYLSEEEYNMRAITFWGCFIFDR